MKESDAIARDKRLARLAVAVDNTPPCGPSPDLFEIDQWRRGRLGPPRSDEVLSHLARDPALMRQLVELEATEAGLAGTRPTLFDRLSALGRGLQRRLREAWRHPGGSWAFGGGLATAALALVVALLLVPATPSLDQLGRKLDAGYAAWDTDYHPDAGAWPWRPAAFTKALRSWRDAGARPPLPEQTAFRYGVRLGLAELVGADKAWQRSIEDLPTAAPDCATADAACARRREAYTAAGRWGVLSYWLCRSPDPASGRAIWSAQRQAAEALLAELPAGDDPLGLTALLAGWSATPLDQLPCVEFEDFLHQGLKSRR